MRLLLIAACVAFVSFVAADLPSCERARCVHCEVEFISKMCPLACGSCAKIGSLPKTYVKSVHPVDQRPPQPRPVSQQQHARASAQVTVAAQPISLQVPVRQAGVPTQVQPRVVHQPQPQVQIQPHQVQQIQQINLQQPTQTQVQPVPLNLLQPAQPRQFAAQAFAAPQVNANYAIDTATLAPIFEHPNAESLNPALARQPADLAQPLPEYQTQQYAQQNHNNNNYYNQQQQQNTALPGFQLPGFQTSASTPGQYGAATGGLGQNQQAFGLGGNQQQNSALFNPFQPFLQQIQTGNSQNALDPFNLFNLGGTPNYAQGAPLAHVAAQPPQPAALQHHSLFPAQPQQTTNNNQATTYTGNYQTLPQQANNQQSAGQQGIQYQQPQALPQIQMPGFPPMPQLPGFGQVPPSPPAPVSIQQPFGQQLQQNQQQQQVQYQQQQRPQQNQQAYQQQNNQYPQQQQQQQQYNLQQPQQIQNQQNVYNQQGQVQQPQYQTQQQTRPVQQPQVQVSQSIDAAPINYQKYVDGKGAVAPPVQTGTCPRQPGWAPCITKDLANDRFKNCCTRLGEGCAPLCNYDATLATMQLAVLTGRCPLNKVGDMMICASGYEDATPCCEAYGVFEPGYEHCRPYCNPAAGLPSGGLLSEKYKCLVKLSAIQQCFYVTQKP